MLAFLDKNEFFDENDILKLKNGLYSYLNKVKEMFKEKMKK